MAYIKNIKVMKSVQKCIRYITDPKKTDGGELISYGGTCPECADPIWEGIRKRYGKDSGVKAHHFIQSFDPAHGVTPQEAQQIGMDLAREQFGKYGFEFIVATHVDTGVIHNHILVNAVSSRTGRKYAHNNSRDFKKNPNSYVRLRQLNIDVCRRHGIPAVDSPKLDQSRGENEEIRIAKKYSDRAAYVKTKAYDSWTEKQMRRQDKIRADIDDAAAHSESWEGYVSAMEAKGYTVKWKRADGSARKNVTYIMQGAERGRRDDTLNRKDRSGRVIDRYSREAIERRIRERITGSAGLEAGGAERASDKQARYWRVYVKSNFFRGFYYEGARYLLHPKYRIVRRHGKVYYVRRSIVETWYIKRFLELPKKAERIERRPAGMDRAYRDRLAAQMEKTVKKCNLLSRHKIASADDAQRARLEYALHRKNLTAQMEKKKEAIRENDRLYDLLRTLETFDGVMKCYEAMPEGKEKTDFYHKNSSAVQEYQYARRELEKSGNGAADVKEERGKLYEEMSALEQEQEECEKMITYLDEIAAEIKGFSSQEQESVQKKDVRERGE